MIQITTILTVSDVSHMPVPESSQRSLQLELPEETGLQVYFEMIRGLLL